MDVEKQAETARQIERDIQDYILQSDSLSGDLARLRKAGIEFGKEIAKEFQTMKQKFRGYRNAK